MIRRQDIVVTGVGVVSPIGIGKEAFWSSLAAGRSGIRRLQQFADGDDLPVPFGGEVADFDPKQFIRPRKSLKVMNRDIQLAFVAADLACTDGGIHERRIDPDRLGVLLGADMMACDLDELTNAYRACMVDGRFDFGRWGPAAMAEIFPLWMLKYLPNMPACHVGIAQDARGPNNTIVSGEVSSLAAVVEAVGVLERGQADVMIVGGSSSRIHPTIWAFSRDLPLSRRSDDPAAACRPFDARRDGMVYGEGAAAFLMETAEHAQSRSAAVQGHVLACSSAFEPCRRGEKIQGRAIGRAISAALNQTGLTPSQVGHVNAHGLSTLRDDQIEAHAIHATLGDVPVTAPKSFFGNLGAAGGAVELAVSLLAIEKGLVPPTLNYQHPDPDCPVNVVHGQPLEARPPTAIVLNHTTEGQAIAVVLAGRQRD